MTPEKAAIEYAKSLLSFGIVKDNAITDFLAGVNFMQSQVAALRAENQELKKALKKIYYGSEQTLENFGVYVPAEKLRKWAFEALAIAQPEIKEGI